MSKYAIKYNPTGEICDIENGVCYGVFFTELSATQWLEESTDAHLLADYSVVPLPLDLTPAPVEYQFECIGTTPLGVEGSDQYFVVRSDRPISDDDLREFVEHKFYVETYQEAGGYFCKQFDIFYRSYCNESQAIVRVCHRYDV